jgi:hypothetical protein
LPPFCRAATVRIEDGRLPQTESGSRPEQEAVMSDTITQQHPAVVLRSHYVLMRTLLAVALIAVIGLTVALVVVASHGATSGARVDAPAISAPTPGVRPDGGPDEGTSGPGRPAPAPAPAVRSDGGPEEGTSGPGR